MKRITILILIFLGNAVFADISSILLKDQQINKLGTGMKFTEGPVWIKKDKKLIFSDIPKSLQMEWTEAKGVKKWREVKQSNGNLLDLNGNLLSCQHAGRNLIRTTANGEIEILADNFGGKKFKYVLLRNDSHESVGDQSTNSGHIDFKLLSKSFGFSSYLLINNQLYLKKVLKRFINMSGSVFLEVRIKSGSIKNLGRPKNLKMIKKKFMLG